MKHSTNPNITLYVYVCVCVFKKGSMNLCL